MQQPTKEDQVEPAPDSKSAKKKPGGRLARWLYYGLPCLVMIAVMVYSVLGILRFQRALAVRDSRARAPRPSDDAMPAPPRLLGPGGQWSFAGGDWDCFHASLSDEELQRNWLRAPGREFQLRGPISSSEQRLLEMLRSEGFTRSTIGGFQLYVVDSEVMKIRFFTLPEVDKERIVSGGFAISVGPDHWEALTLTMPRWESAESKGGSMISMPTWTSPLCRRLDGQDDSAFEIHTVETPETPDAIYRQLKSHWENDGWSERRGPTEHSFAQWQRGERVVMARVTGQRPGDVKIVLVDGSVKVGEPF